MEPEQNNNDIINISEDEATEEERPRGRQRIEMKKISNKDDLMISFSKRRSGIYKKASEISTLCGAEVGLVVFSPTGKPFSFGTPSVPAVLNRFITGQEQLPEGVDPLTAPIVEAHRRRRVAELSLRHDGLFRDLDNQRALYRELQGLRLNAGQEEENEDGDDDDDEVVAEAEKVQWWEEPLEGLPMRELDERKERLKELHAKISDQLELRNNFAAIGTSNAVTPPPPPPPYFGAASSSNAGGGYAPAMLPPAYFGAASSSAAASYPPAMLPPPYFGAASSSNTAAAASYPPDVLPPPYFGSASSSNGGAAAYPPAMPPPPPYFGGDGFGSFGN